MYHPAIIAIERAKVERALHGVLPFGLREYSVEECREFNELRLRDVYKDFDKYGNPINPTRGLTQEESTFVTNERIMVKLSYRYWAERYCVVNLGGQTLGSLFPLWESQELALSKIAALQKERYESGYPDGVIADILKARQMGFSTLAESLAAHRTTTHANVAALLASDVPENSAHLFDMYERVVDNLPWYIRPTVTEAVKNDEMVFATHARLLMGASKSTRGADKLSRRDQGGKKGQLGRGRTLSVVHLSELATWTNPNQIDTSLEPGIPRSPFTLWLKESTAQGRGPKNWWYVDWQLAKSNKGRSAAIFIGWYMEKSKYWLPALPGWSPSPDTLAHARRIEETSPRWMNGKTYVCTRDQLLWYERTKAEKIEKGQLEEFLQEYPADDEEAFQLSGKGVFNALLRERIKAQARPLSGLVEVKPHREMVA